jgi:hypothetical protein
MAEYYPDTIAVESSSLSVITNWFVTQLVLEYRSFTPGVVSSSLTGPTRWMNSSTAEQVFVRHKVESSNLSSSAKCECDKVGEL